MMMLVLLLAVLGSGEVLPGVSSGAGAVRRPLLMWAMRELTAGASSTIVLMLSAWEAAGSLA